MPPRVVDPGDRGSSKTAYGGNKAVCFSGDNTQRRASGGERARFL